MANKSTSYFEKFCGMMEQNTKGVEIGVYAVAGGLLLYSWHRKRPITRFGKPSDIPSHFVKEKIVQNGVVERIEPSLLYGPLIIVKHKPPVNLFSKSKTLPIKLSGISINSNGYSWLQTIVSDKQIQFLPLSNKGNYAADCRVVMIEKNKKPLDISKALLSLGFAQSVPVPREFVSAKDKSLQKYFQQLSSTEKKAKSRRAGLWAEKVPPPTWPVKFLKNQMDNVVFSLIPKRFETLRLPELVR